MFVRMFPWPSQALTASVNLILAGARKHTWLPRRTKYGGRKKAKNQTDRQQRGHLGHTRCKPAAKARPSIKGGLFVFSQEGEMIRTSTKINAAQDRIYSRCGEVGRSSPHNHINPYPYKEPVMDQTTEFTDAQDTVGTNLDETSTETSTTPSDAQAQEGAPADTAESQDASETQDSAQAKVEPSDGAKAASTTKARKPKKARVLSRERIDEIADEMTKHADAGHFADGRIPVDHASKHFNITVPLVERVFIQAITEHGLSGYKLDYGNDGSGKGSNECYIDDRGMILIGKSIIEGFNSKSDLGCKFEKGDKFTVTCSDNEIVLTIKR